MAIRHCARVSKLVGELLELAKLDSYEVRVKREPFNLRELLQDVVQKFQLKAEEKQIKIETDIQETLPFVNADIALIERVMENLLENALDYKPQGGSVSLSLTPEGEDILVKVSDTGCGIPEDQMPYIFDRFYQLEKRRSGEEGHSGLGLAIAQKILDLHGKSITVTSSQGSGTSFSFHLPFI